MHPVDIWHSALVRQNFEPWFSLLRQSRVAPEIGEIAFHASMMIQILACVSYNEPRSAAVSYAANKG
jgi:hypothetical protein